MKKKLLVFGVSAFIVALLISTIAFTFKTSDDDHGTIGLKAYTKEKSSKKTMDEKMATIEGRFQFEYDMQKNPLTGLIPPEEKSKELNFALESKTKALEGSPSKSFSTPYISRGPSNLGGRTRGLTIDISDPTGNTMLAGGVSSGLFRSTNGGVSWEKVSNNDEIHNVTAIAQDPRPGFQNIWYYGTGELLGNSASLGSFHLGQGIWQSVDGGITWTQIPQTNSEFGIFDTRFDIINSLAVSPITGELFVAVFREIFRYDGVEFNSELRNTSGGGTSDVKVTSTGRVFASLEGSGVPNNGVFTSETGNGNYVNIGSSGSPVEWSSVGRVVLGIAPSNPDMVYALFGNGNSEVIEADLWRYDLSTDTWTDFTNKMPDEPEADLVGNDPFAIQGGYDLEVSVKPDDENFVVIGGTNVYRINNINTDVTFDRIGGYRDNLSYSFYNLGGDVHHPDIHDLVFSPFNSDLLYTGTDGGVHSADITLPAVGWTNLNNNYQTYQYYHVGMDPQAGSDLVIGGAQDNGTTLGGNEYFSNINSATEMLTLFGGDGVAVSVGRTGPAADLNDLQLYFGAQLGVFFTLRNNDFFNLVPIDARGDNNKSIFITYFYLDAETNILFYVNGNDVYKTEDASTVTGSTYTDIGSLSTNENIRSIASTRGPYTASSYALFGGQNGGVFRLDDPRSNDLSTAINITPSEATVANFSVVSGIAIHPTNPDIAMVVYSNYGINNIFITTNATSATPSWDLVERNLVSHSIRSAAIAEVNGEVGYFVGTARGLYASRDPTKTDWELESPDEIGLAVVSSLVYRPSDNRLLVGTHGNGMYQSSLSTLGVDDNVFETTDVTLYPNPASGPVKITYNSAQTIKNIIVTNLNGKVVLKQAIETMTSDIQLDTQNLSAGMYFVSLTIDTGDSIIKKLIIQ